MCLSFFLLLIYLLIIIFNIYNSIYLSKQLHIIDDPEYTGKKNDHNYKDYNENKYLDIPLKQFIIAGFFPSIISVLNILCAIFCIAFRKKMILTYNKMLSTKEDNKNNEVIMHRHKPKHRYSYKGNTRRNSTEKRRKTNEENENIQKELNKIKIRHNSTTTKKNNSNKRNQNFIHRESKKDLIDNRLRQLEVKKNINSETKDIKLHKSKKSKFNVINTPQTTKSNSTIDSQNNLENDKDIDKKNDNEN